MVAGVWSNTPVADSDWTFVTTSIIDNYRGTNLYYCILCGAIISDSEEK